jgi:hypothetical protein
MLDSYGITKSQWNLDLDNNLIQLIFELEYEKDGQMVKRLIKVAPALFYEKRRTYDKVSGKHIVENEPNLAASMRMLRNWLKSRLEAITYGLFSAEDELLSQIVINRSGQTIGEKMVSELPSSPALESAR